MLTGIDVLIGKLGTDNHAQRHSPEYRLLLLYRVEQQLGNKQAPMA